jgi:uncharacterized protein with HEPN domain
MTEEDKVYLNNILDCIDQINNYTDELCEKEFLDHPMAQDAVIRNFEIIGEATKLLSKSIRNKYDHIPWGPMAGMRDKLIHDYMGVDFRIIWDTINDILPSLRSEIESILGNY